MISSQVLVETVISPQVYDPGLCAIELHSISIISSLIYVNGNALKIVPYGDWVCFFVIRFHQTQGNT